MRTIRKVVVLGANGTLGSAAAAMFAAAGVPTVLLARTPDRAETARIRAEQLARGRRSLAGIGAGTYADLEHALTGADLVFEAVTEDPAIKRDLFAVIDRLRDARTIVATATARLSIASLAAGRSASFQRNFLGIHLFHPPTVIAGCELVAHAGSDPGAVSVIRDFLTREVGREVVETSDTPGFAANRVGFKLLNEVAQLAEEHGVAVLDQLVGSHTGRTIAPLAAIDLLGWDVHKATVDHLYDATHDAAHDQFRLPAYMQRGLERGLLGRKTRDRGGFYRVEGTGAAARQLVLDPVRGEHRPISELARPAPEFVDAMKAQIRSGRDRGYRGAMEILCAATGSEADLLRRILLGYISYGLGLVGDVVERPRDIDRIMAFGFLWAPPSVLVDAIGPGRTIVLLEHARLPIPRPVLDAAVHQRALFDEPRVDRARFFVVAA